MAEFVQFRAEEWVTELEMMERIGLFEPKEIKSIIRNRRELEYKIQRKTKCKEDYLKYIQFEIDLNRIIKARRKKTGIKTKKAEVDFSQVRRIGNLFKMAIFRFRGDIKLWMSFFKFCEGVRFHSLVSRMLVNMLKIHSDKPDLWVFASKWEFRKCRSVSNARHFLTKGLRHHPSSAVLYQELFNLELENRLINQKRVEKLKKNNENFTADEVTTRIIDGKVADVIYETGIKEIKGVDFKISMFNIASQKKANQFLKIKILKSIVKNHLDEEETWNVLAQEEFKGYSYDIDELIGKEKRMEVVEEEKKKEENEKMEAEEKEAEKNEKKMEVVEEKEAEEKEKNREERMEVVEEKEKEEGEKMEGVEKKGVEKTEKKMEVFEEKEEGKIEIVQEKETEEKMEVVEEKEKKPKEEESRKRITRKTKIQKSIRVYKEAVKKFNSDKMWNFYLDFVLKLNEDAKTLVVFKTRLLNIAMEAAMNSGHLAEKYYIEWISRLQKEKKAKVDLSQVLKNATEDHPKSLKLWYAHLKFCLTRDEEKRGMEVFNNAIKNLPDGAPLWSLTVKYLLKKSSPKTEELLQNGVKQGGEVAQVLKPFYIEWLFHTKGIEEARTAFESSEMNLYPCLGLYKKMAELELSQAEPRLDKVRKCHELACKYFGKDDPNTWLDYVRFELNNREVSKVAQLHRKALQDLNPESADEFLTKYNNLKMDVST